MLSLIGFGTLTEDANVYDGYAIQGCEESVVQFYNNAYGLNTTFGWKMAATPGSTTLVEFSTDFPNIL